jgi:flagellar biosynthesis protein FlhF
MSLVRSEMGEDAIILSSERSRRGIEVKAAAERRPEMTDNHPSADRMALLEAELERRLVAAVAQPPQTPSTAPAEPWTLESVIHKLCFHEIPGTLTQALCEIAARLGGPAGPETLGQAIEARFLFRPLPPEPDAPIMVIGAPGAGKTASAAKLAVRSVLAGKPAILISTDLGAGATSQMESFAHLIRMPFLTVDTPEALGDAVQEAQASSDERTIVIDTPGINPFDRADTAHIRTLVQLSGAEPVLVTPAHGGGDLEDQAMLFKAMGASRMIVTRLDLTRRLGGLFQAADRSGLAFAQGSSSPYIAETLEPLNPYALARRLLNGAPA